MYLKDIGIFLKYKAYSEKFFIVSIFSRDNGKIEGIIPRAKSSVPQPGDVVNFSQKSRLETHLAQIKIEVEKSNSALLFLDSLRAYILQSMLEILCKSLPESHPYPKLWHYTLQTLEDFKDINIALKKYCLLELEMLTELGFGLNLKECAVTGISENLSHVSPRTGRVVCDSIAQPYIDKLLKLPEFFISENASIINIDYVYALNLTGYFLRNHLLPDHKLPTCREELIKTLISTANV